MERFGGYELRERLGIGGMAEVFLAYREGASATRPVVIKRMLPHIAEDQHFAAMFRDEARTAAQVTDDGVCRVFELGESDGQPFIVMEYLRGVTLVELMQKHAMQGRQVDQRLAASLIMGAADGLQAVHDVSIIHRDVSLSNVFVTVNGVVKILDFGIAKSTAQRERTRAGTIKGKYSFMSPEQLLGRQLDSRSDLFSLGTLAFILFTGHHPFRHRQEYETIKSVVQYPIPDPLAHRFELAPQVADVILKAHARIPDDRFATARQMRGALARATRSLGAPMSRAAVGAEIRRLFADELRESRRRLTGTHASRAPVSSSPPAPRRRDPVLAAHLASFGEHVSDMPPLVAPMAIADHTPPDPTERFHAGELEQTSEMPEQSAPTPSRHLSTVAYYLASIALFLALALTMSGHSQP